MKPSPEQLAAAHHRNLKDEEIGVRHRFSEYYLPMFKSFPRQMNRDLAAEVGVLDCGCGNGASVEYLAKAGLNPYLVIRVTRGRD